MKKVSYKKVFVTLDEIIKEHEYQLNEVDFVVGISRGGLLPAMYIATKLNKPLVAAYIDKEDKVYFDRDEWVKGKNVLLVDDIVRSGKTIVRIKGMLIDKEVKGIETLTIFYLPNDIYRPNYGVETKVDICFPWDYDK